MLGLVELSTDDEDVILEGAVLCSVVD